MRRGWPRPAPSRPSGCTRDETRLAARVTKHDWLHSLRNMTGCTRDETRLTARRSTAPQVPGGGHDRRSTPFRCIGRYRHASVLGRGTLDAFCLLTHMSAWFRHGCRVTKVEQGMNNRAAPVNAVPVDRLPSTVLLNSSTVTRVLPPSALSPALSNRAVGSGRVPRS